MTAPERSAYEHSEKDTLRDEHPEELIRFGERGKSARQYTKGRNIVPIEPDGRRAFTDPDAVDEALRESLSQKHAATKPVVGADS